MRRLPIGATPRPGPPAPPPTCSALQQHAGAYACSEQRHIRIPHRLLARLVSDYTPLPAATSLSRPLSVHHICHVGVSDPCPASLLILLTPRGHATDDGPGMPQAQRQPWLAYLVSAAYLPSRPAAQHFGSTDTSTTDALPARPARSHNCTQGLLALARGPKRQPTPPGRVPTCRAPP